MESKIPSSFKFLSTIYSKHLNCKVCSLLMLDPVRLNRCGHTFCGSCVNEKSIKKCPICLQKIHEKQKDILASRLIGQLAVQCLNQGCPWKGTFEEYRQFHENACGLKNGGMEAWLKQLEETIRQNSNIDGFKSWEETQKKRKNQSEEEPSETGRNIEQRKDKKRQSEINEKLVRKFSQIEQETLKMQKKFIKSIQ